MFTNSAGAVDLIQKLMKFEEYFCQRPLPPLPGKNPGVALAGMSHWGQQVPVGVAGVGPVYLPAGEGGGGGGGGGRYVFASVLPTRVTAQILCIFNIGKNDTRENERIVP